MKTKLNINGLDTLEKEIYHLQLKALETENKLKRNLEYMENDFGKLLSNSLHCSRHETGACTDEHSEAKAKTTKQAVTETVVNFLGQQAMKGAETLFRKWSGKK